MKKALSVTAALAVAVVAVALAQAQQNQQQQQQEQQARQAGAQEPGAQSQNMDEEFVKDAAADNMFEVKLGQFIEQRVQDPQIKQFAQMLVQDHQQAQQQLQQAAEQAKLQVPQQLPQSKQAMLEEIQQKQGRGLETCFVFDQVGDHRADLLKARYEAQNGQHTQIKQYAEQSETVLRKHLREAEQLADRFVPGNEAEQAGEHIRGAVREGLNRAGQTGSGTTGSGTNTGGTTSGGTTR